LKNDVTWRDEELNYNREKLHETLT